MLSGFIGNHLAPGKLLENTEALRWLGHPLHFNLGPFQYCIQDDYVGIKPNILFSRKWTHADLLMIVGTPGNGSRLFWKGTGVTISRHSGRWLFGNEVSLGPWGRRHFLCCPVLGKAMAAWVVGNQPVVLWNLVSSHQGDMLAGQASLWGVSFQPKGMCVSWPHS